VALDPQTAAIAGVELAYRPVPAQGVSSDQPALGARTTGGGEDGDEARAEHPVH